MSSRGIDTLSYAVRPRLILKYLGQLALPLVGMLLLPLLVALLYSDWEFALRSTILIAVLLACAIPLSRLHVAADIQLNEALCVTALLFILAAALMIWPLQSGGMSWIDALFESVSAITTTGLSTLQSVEALPYPILFARAWMQWYGGLAIVVLALALVLEPGPVALRLREAGASEDELIGSTRVRARRLLVVYAVLTMLAVAALVGTGMPAFDALIHALSAISTGGFSGHDNSIGGFEGTAARLVATGIGLVGAISFAAWYRGWAVGWRSLLQDVELRSIVMLILLATIIIVLLELQGGRVSPSAALMLASSAQTTTGFTPVAINELQPGSQLVLIFSMLIGGSSGATAGGIKIVRLLLVLRLLQWWLRRTALAPHAVAELDIAGERPRAREIQIVLLVVLLYPAVIGLSWLCFLADGQPVLASLFEVTSAVGTVGLSSGVAAPALSLWLKMLLCLDMLMGRLEIVAMLVLFYPRTWVGQRAESGQR